MPQTEQQRQAAFQAAGLSPEQQQNVVQGGMQAAPVAPQATPVAQQTQPFTQGTPEQTGQEAFQAAKTGEITQPQTGTLQFDPNVNPSVVDLLNQAGADSSYQSRQQLAKQYGIQGYTGTPSQNIELARKFADAFNAKKGTAVPQTGAEARGALDQFLSEQPQQKAAPEQEFFDSLAGLNPVERNLFDQLNQVLSTQNKQQTFSQIYAEEVAKQGIPGLQMELADINRIMEGTEDDIRAEIESAGGLATDSQVRALTGARNKTLLREANFISNQLAAKNDYVDTIVRLTQADRDQVDRDLDRKLGISSMMMDVYNRSVDAQKENYRMMVDTVGWDGLSEALSNDPEQMRKVEKLFDLAPGELQALGSFRSAEDEAAERESELRLKNLELQNVKLQQSLNQTPSVSTSVVDLGGGKKVLINTQTGGIIAEYGADDAPADIQQTAIAQENINAITSLVNDPALGGAVGPNWAARVSPLNIFTGAKSNFIASVEQLSSNLSLDNLIAAKARGATFGALSDSELKILSAAASKLGTWVQKDDNNNVTGYKVSEKKFKQELDKINNFAKLDFILKGGDPASVGVEQMADGTYWTKNSDGTYTQLQ